MSQIRCSFVSSYFVTWLYCNSFDKEQMGEILRKGGPQGSSTRRTSACETLVPTMAARDNKTGNGDIARIGNAEQQEITGVGTCGRNMETNSENSRNSKTREHYLCKMAVPPSPLRERDEVRGGKSRPPGFATLGCGAAACEWAGWGHRISSLSPNGGSERGDLRP